MTDTSKYDEWHTINTDPIEEKDHIQSKNAILAMRKRRPRQLVPNATIAELGSLCNGLQNTNSRCLLQRDAAALCYLQPLKGASRTDNCKKRGI